MKNLIQAQEDVVETLKIQTTLLKELRTHVVPELRTNTSRKVFANFLNSLDNNNSATANLIALLSTEIIKLKNQ